MNDIVNNYKIAFSKQVIELMHRFHKSIRYNKVYVHVHIELLLLIENDVVRDAILAIMVLVVCPVTLLHTLLLSHSTMMISPAEGRRIRLL